MICIRCVGGLGNRLFIYAFARSLQLDSREDVIMYHSWQSEVECSAQGFFRMLPENQKITHVDESVDCNIWKSAPLRLFVCRALLKICKKIYSHAGLAEIEAMLQPLWNHLGLCMVTDGYLPFLQKTLFQKYICMGYFQSRKFWGKHSEEIRRELYRPELISKESQDYLEQIQRTNSVCLHIRLGDYVNNPETRKVHYVCDEAYYMKAVEKAMEKIESPTFFAFTNERAVAEKFLFPKDTNVVWIPSGEAVNDLQLMAQCKHFIIANSSYSWWAQFLGAAPEKLVFAPDKWVHDREKPMDLYEKTWILIPTA